MSVSQMLLPEFDNEMQITRKILERVPEDRPDYRPHPKSMPLARLAGHVAELPGWGVNTLTQDSLDFAPPGAPPFKPCVMESRKHLLETFDAGVTAARAAIAAAKDEDMGKPWSLLRGGQTLLKMPRIAVLRNMVFNHVIHHRAQLGVYLRMNDIPLPPTYGPTADEGRM